MSKKFLVLYTSSASSAEQMANSDLAVRDEAMKLWQAWMAKAGSAVVDLGSPLAEAGVVPPGTNAAARHIGGYSILQGESVTEITALLDGHPHFHSPDATIEVLEYLTMPGVA